MKKIFFILLFVPFLGMSQSFIFCPKIKVEVKNSTSNEKVNIVFKDSRTYEKKVKDKCSCSKIFDAFYKYTVKAFPNVPVVLLTNENFDAQANKGEVTCKINFIKYEAVFDKGTYTATVRFDVSIIDNRSKLKLSNKLISAEESKFNLWGFKSGKMATNDSFKKTFDEFVILLEKTLTEKP